MIWRLPCGFFLSRNLSILHTSRTSFLVFLCIVCMFSMNCMIHGCNTLLCFGSCCIPFCCACHSKPCIFCLQLCSLFLIINKLLLVFLVSLVHVSFSDVTAWLFSYTFAQCLFPGHFPVAVSLLMSFSFWLLWQDSKWVEEKQFLLKTNQELHEKVRRKTQYQPSLFSYIEVAKTVHDGETTQVLKSTIRYGFASIW